MPAALNFIRAADVAPVRWRNGGGWTRELVAWPGAEDWVVRLSVADIACDGPFSAYPGVERWFAVLDGGGVELSDADGVVRLRAGDAIHRFRGESAPACRLLDGPTRDFNLMLRRDAGTATITALPTCHTAASDWSGCFAASPLRARLAGTRTWHNLPERSLAWTTAPASLEIDAGGGRGWRGWRIDVTLAEGVS